MKNKMAIVGVCLALTSCATPITTMSKGSDVVTCGGGTSGSLTGGLVGYSIQEGHDQDCVKEYANKGYKIVTPKE